MATFKVGQAPWEVSTAQTFPVGSAPWEKPVAPPSAPVAPQIPNYLQRVGADYSRIGSRLVSDLTKTGTKAMEKGGLKGGVELLRGGLRAAGAVAEAAFTPILEAPVVKQVTEGITSAVMEIPGVKELSQAASDLAQKHPTAAQDLFDIVNIASLGAGSAVQKPVLNEARALTKDVAGATRAALTPSEQAIQKQVVSLFQKSIKPTGKKTLQQAERYDNDVLNALRTIKTNSDKLNIEDATGELVAGRPPKTISELSQAVEQTKKIVFTQYDELAKKSNKAGVEIDATPIAVEVGKVAENKALQLTNPEIITYAQSWQKRLQDMGSLDTETTQEVIRLMNQNLQAFYRNPTYDAASKVTIDAGIANNFRVALDKAIETATGEQYQVLKRQYAALKAIENDVVRAALREGRKNTKGLIDYTDIFTSGQMLAGLLSLNPAMFTKGAIERGFKEYMKYLNDPNRAIDNIFNKLNIDTTQTFTPQSATFQAVSGVPASPVQVQ